MNKNQIDLEIDLGSFDQAVRKSALRELKILLDSAQVSIVPEFPAVNLHCHTFFSFNAYGYSPSAFAWEALKRGLCAAGIVDFDVLHGVEEFLEGCAHLGVRSTAGIEARVFIPEWKELEINSPGEPGICYFMGYGFTEGSPDSSRHAVLKKMADLSRQRNEEMLEKVNSYLGNFSVDYDDEVLPFTPSGNATERHMLLALEMKSRKLFEDPEKRARFWADATGAGIEEVMKLMGRPADLQMLIRAKLMKKGSPGYCVPEERSFPRLEEMISMTRDLGGIGNVGWLKGMSDGEENPAVLLDFMKDKGGAVLCVIPDRNWDIKDEEEKQVKVNKLYDIVGEARKRKMPVIAGTEMNKHGQKFVDDFFADALKPVKEEFLRGARIVTGHTLLKQTLGIGLLSQETEERFSGDLDARNSFFEKVGAFKPADDINEGKELAHRIGKMWDEALKN
jgi:hypothetical protein